MISTLPAAAGVHADHEEEAGMVQRPSSKVVKAGQNGVKQCFCFSRFYLHSPSTDYPLIQVYSGYSVIIIIVCNYMTASAKIKT